MTDKNNHPNRSPFPFRVTIAGTVKPRAGFATQQDAEDYALWASTKRPGNLFVVTTGVRHIATFEGGNAQ